MRPVLLCLAICLSVVCAGCEKSPEQREREQAEIDAKVAEKLRGERIAEARALSEEVSASKERAKLREEDIRREASEAFSKYEREWPKQEMGEIQDAATLEAAATRVRMLMSDPSSMEVRKSSFNGDKTAVCMEIDYKEPGFKVSGRQAVVTSGAVLVEPDKNNVAHKVFENSARDLGCDVALAAPSKGK
ncbi:MAG TPA: hypothetical protein VEN29_01030 [Casimicrobiaceae bacterium]|nr:hypothetical protein [Casimicrobiaceae bacterium]